MSRLAQRLASRPITVLTVELHSEYTGPPAHYVTSPSRWATREFYAYYLVFATVVPYMVKVAVDLSRSSHPNYPLFSEKLHDGWLFGWKIDRSDAQWDSFRSNVPILMGVVALLLLFKRGCQLLRDTPQSKVVANLVFSTIFIVVLHGTSALKIAIIVYLNFLLVHSLLASEKYQRFTPFAAWAFNLAILFSNELCGGYSFASLSRHLAVLDAYSGIFPRWHISWNITMLRLVSFSMDYYWAVCGNTVLYTMRDEASAVKHDAVRSQNEEKPLPATAPPVTVFTERQRIKQSHSLSDYTFTNLASYALYTPLYLAGPIITFNSYISQTYTAPAIRRATLVSYAVRLAACMLIMEFITHTMYVVAIKDESAWANDSPLELSMIGFWNLIIVWLKLLIPWRFFRMWALLDGIDPPENMVRCMANNYSTLGFWRAWHRSFNLWVVRYVYIPIGGAKHALLSTIIVFTFVALWHDLSLRLLTWGWAITLFVLPEMAARSFVPYEKYHARSWYRHLAAVGGVINVLMMMTGNLIGFAIGTDGAAYMWSQLINTRHGQIYMLEACFCLFVAVQVMFEYREEEKRRGIFHRS